MQFLSFPAPVAHRNPPDFHVLARRHEHELLNLQTALAAGDARITEAVAAFVSVKRRAHRLPTRIPDGPALLHVQATSVIIHRDVVVPVTREAAQPGVLPERVPPGRLRAKAEKLVLAEHIEPGQGCVRTRDDKFAVRIVEVAVFHGGQGTSHSRCQRKKGAERPRRPGEPDLPTGRDVPGGRETSKPGEGPGLEPACAPGQAARAVRPRRRLGRPSRAAAHSITRAKTAVKRRSLPSELRKKSSVGGNSGWPTVRACHQPARVLA